MGSRAQAGFPGANACVGMVGKLALCVVAPLLRWEANLHWVDRQLSAPTQSYVVYELDAALHEVLPRCECEIWTPPLPPPLSHTVSLP
jgi:hypothetical protein